MFCKNCGKEIDDNAVVCPNCGVATEKLQETTAATQVEEKKKTNVFAIIGFILSLVTWGMVFVNTYAYWICFVAGLVLSILGIVWAAKKNANLKGLAIAGVVLTAVSVVFWIIIVVVLVALIGSIL